jgi:hypothetical protein
MNLILKSVKWLARLCTKLGDGWPIAKKAWLEDSWLLAQGFGNTMVAAGAGGLLVNTRFRPALINAQLCNLS